MTPHEHYREAERLLDEAVSWHTGQEETDRVVLAAAQVHATLASVVSWPTEER